MLCTYPRTVKEKQYPCGKCPPCRINRRATWTTRLVLETSLHSNNCFVTLTYDDESLPRHNSLEPSHTRAFIKALRYQYGKFRYYLVGEYGSSEQTARPHYHALLFGLNLPRVALEDIWQKGRCHSGTCTHESAQYVAGYINSTTKPEDLTDRYPEYSRMSRNPGIGFDAVAHLVSFHHTKAGCEYLTKNRDVIGSVRYGQRIRPLGRYIVRKAREQLGIPHSDPNRPHHTDNLTEDEIYQVENKRNATAIITHKTHRHTQL